jgi:signal transduction histidine kinase
VNNSYQLLSIVDHCLNVYSLESGLVSLNESKVNLNELCNSIKAIFRGSMKSSDISFSFFPSLPDLSATFEVDEEKLVDVLSSLLLNAFNYTKSGYIHFGYTIEPGFVQFFVDDTGIGIPEDKIDSIFDPFSKVDYAQKTSGVGLGLTICRHYAHLMGGDIWATSTLGKGSNFYFSIPIKESTFKTPVAG